MYSSDPGLIIGFHGCDQHVRDSIVSGQSTLKSSKNKWDWLGEGMYFWQNNYERALHYAQNPPAKSSIKIPAVLGAIFNLGHCLDLTDKEGIDLVRRSHEILSKSAEQEQKELPRNVNPNGSKDAKDKIIRKLDCAVINNIHSLMERANEAPFESVRAVFFEGAELYKDAGFLDKTHVQICIRNPNLIKAFFVPRKTVKWPS
ncbi:hypothetical protein GWR21_15770 [Chitinophaga agri]|uniref:PARP catalytic domain-containing protein n=1 Tax=Chitinophaga agri TaxID=2703787 RepID=A0A6B9ZQA1_9BACT|nr:hypothetical protein GWR21_15770 [Chitinophaga agri]